MRNESVLEQKLFTPATKGRSRALVIGGGGTYGAWYAGFLSTFGRELPNFFDAIYPVSVGGYEAVFYTANQPKTIENTWRERVHGLRLVNPFNAIINRPVLKLEYLTKIFRNDISWLNTNAVLKGITPVFALTDLETGKPVYRKPQDADELFALMKASSSLPICRPAIIDGREYVDGVLSIGGFPLAKALKDKHDEILVLSSRQKGYYNKPTFKVVNQTLALHAFLRGQTKLAELCLQYGDRLRESNTLARSNPERVEIVEPDRQILYGVLDCNKKRLNATVDLGIEDAEKWLKSHWY